MKKLFVIAAVAVMAVAPAQAGGFLSKKPLGLTNITGVVSGVGVGNVNVLNGTTVAVGKNSNILSGNVVGNNLFSGNSVLSGIGVLQGNTVLGIIGGGSGSKKR